MVEPSRLLSLFRAFRLALHLLHGALLAVIYPALSGKRQLRVLKTWSRQLLAILGILVHSEGMPEKQARPGCMLIANHVSWLDIFVLNSICPARFIAKSEVRDWPLIGWLCQRCGTLFIERTRRQDATSINRQISALLEQGICVGLFPEGTTTDGTQVGKFHASLIQPAVATGASLWPVALRYQDRTGKLSTAAAFTGDTTLADSIWCILRSRQISAVAGFTPALVPGDANRRVLAHTAQLAIALELDQAALRADTALPASAPEHQLPPSRLTRMRLSTQSAYVLLLDPILNNLHK